MSAMGFHGLSYWPLAALAVPVVVFYFLKLRRDRAEIPSLVLWRQVMEDRRVNSPFQRFKRNILLLLQLLLLACLCLAAMQPFFHGANGAGRHLPILIDHSASMGALDKPHGRTRLDEAKRLVRERIDNLGKTDDDRTDDQDICLIAFARDGRRLTGFTSNKRELHDALDAIEIEDVPSNPTTALQLTQALARTTGFERAELVTDGNLPEQVDAELAFKLDYRRVATAGAPPNLGITSCNAQRRADGHWEVFIGIESAAEAPASATLELVSGGHVLEQRPLQPQANGVERVSFLVPGDEAIELEARLHSDGFDALAADDRAYLVLPAIRPMRVWIAPALRAWRHAASALGGLDLHPAAGAADAGAPTTGDAKPVSYDLTITDQVSEAALPAAVRVTVGLVPPALREMITVSGEGGSSLVDYRRSDALLAHVVLDDLLVNERVSFAPGCGEKELEALGFEVLVHGDRGPLMIARSRGGALDCHLLFHSDRSTLPYRVGFPVLVANLVSAAMGATGQAESTCVSTGVLPPISIGAGQSVMVDIPGGGHIAAVADGDGVVAGVRAARAGIYHMASPGRAIDVGVGLLNATETRLGSVESVRFREVAVQASAGAIPGERALWPKLALAAILVCLAEWWYFHRRPSFSSGSPP